MQVNGTNPEQSTEDSYKNLEWSKTHFLYSFFNSDGIPCKHERYACVYTE